MGQILQLFQVAPSARHGACAYALHDRARAQNVLLGAYDDRIRHVRDDRIHLVHDDASLQIQIRLDDRVYACAVRACAADGEGG